MMKLISKGIFYFVALCLILWTASLTYSFVSEALPDQPITRYFALIVFDVGMVAWLMIFMFGAEGIAQRAIALVLSTFDLLGVCFMVYAEIFLGGQSFADVPENIGMYALYAIVIWTAINLVGVWAYHYTEPENLKRMKIRGAEDKLQSQTLKKLEDKIDDIADSVADKEAEYLKDKVILGFGNAGNGRTKKTANPTSARRRSK